MSYPGSMSETSTPDIPATSSAPSEPFSFDDIASFVRAPRISGVAASREGTIVATLRRIDVDGSALVDQLIALEEDDEGRLRWRALTHGDKSATLLAVGHRGEVYFSRSDPREKDEGDAVWMLPPRGEARVVLRHRGGVESLEATATRLVVVAPMMPSASTPEQSDELATARTDAKASAVLHDRYPIRFWNTDLGPAESRLFTARLPDTEGVDDAPVELTAHALPGAPANADQWDLDGVAAVPDGSAAVVTMSTRRAIDASAQVWVVDLLGDTPPRLLAAEDAEHSWESTSHRGLAVSPDGTWVLTGREIPPLPGQLIAEDLERIDVADGRRTTLTRAYDGLPGDAVIGAESTVWFTADRHGRGGVFSGDNDGSATLRTPDDEAAYSSLTWAGGRLVALRSSILEPPSVVLIDPDSGEVTPTPSLVDAVDVPGELTEVSADALDGTPLRAWLALPEGEGPHPLVVFAHGGPWGSWNDWTWRWNPWIFVARGYAVLLPDPGISTGYGQALTARGHDSIGNEPFTDILALTDATVARPDIDEGRQALAGGSYGGYMANWVAGHTGTRFHCIVTHAGLWDVDAMSQTTDNGSWYRWMVDTLDGGTPQAEVWSPHAFLENIEVPMLVIHGDKDYRVPFSQALELWAGLQRTNPTLGHRFLYFPDEGHWILKPGNAEVWYKTFVAFLDEHMLGKNFERPKLLG